MQYEMPALTEEERQTLIGLCRIEVKRWKHAAEAVPDKWYMVELMEIALAALSAEPVGEIIQFTDRVTGEKSKWRFSNNICGDTRGDAYQTTTKLVYTAPPAAPEAPCLSASSS